MKNIFGIALVTVYIPDFEEGYAFYHDILGLEKLYDMGNEACYFSLTDGRGLYLQGGCKTAIMDDGISRASFVLAARDAFALFSHLQAHDVEILQEQPVDMGAGDYWFQCADPAGNIIEFLGGKKGQDEHPDPGRKLHHETMVTATPRQLWEAWTTVEGIRSFFAPDANIDPRPGGAFEIFFVPDAEPGFRGAEGTTFLSLQPEKMLSFTWTGPPSIPETRHQFTSVSVNFVPLDQETTRVVLEHTGWGTGDAWDKTWDYFNAAWGKAVLPNLKKCFE